MKKGTKDMKGFYKITFLIGLGFFTMGLMDPLYDTYVPIFLSNYLKSMGLVGIIMTLDNLFAVFLIPIVSALSDRTRTPIGRRMPYIIVTLPLTAVFFASIPSAALKSLAFLIIVIFLLNIFKQAARGPVVALMPDTIPGHLRSEANGVINTMGGIAAIVGTVALAKLFDLNVRLPLFGENRILFPSKDPSAVPSYVGKLPFLISGILVILATILLFLFVKERKEATEKQEKKTSVKESLKMIAGAGDKSALFILLSLLLWFIGYQGVLPFIGKYSRDILGTTEGTAALAAGMVAIAYALFAIPSGIIAHKIGRKKTIRISLLFLTAILLIIFFHDPVTTALGFSSGAKLASFWVLMFLFGAFWVSIITNSFPMLWQMATYSDMGIYTGLYYTFSQTAAILAPPITGFIIDLSGFRGIFLFAMVCMFSAFLIMGLVKKGEPEEDPA
ncbi:MAG: MFS transporter [Spirochaetales bacterium]|nr:MFS transporter [Spirochaetales bacterium]